MDDQTATAVVEQPQDLNRNEEDSQKTVAENSEQETIQVIKDDKNSDSDANSEDSTNNNDQINVNVNSQFYESSDSKIDYAIKIDDSDTLSDVEDIKTDSASADSEDSALGSLPPDVALNEREEEVQDRSDGSDSGIGSEINEDAKVATFGLEIPCTSGLSEAKAEKDKEKEHFEMVVDQVDSGAKNDETDTKSQFEKPLRSSLKRKCEEENIKPEEPQLKKKKRNITFDNVTVFYFPRAQGFSCVPSQGGSTLGMEREHTHVERFTLAEHALEQRRLHRQILQQIKNERHSLQGATFSSSEDSDTEEETSDLSESELDLENYYFLQPVSTRQRRALLRAGGVRKIEAYEKDECRDIRTSREFCGCACKGMCHPETCSCSASGIKCQVDRLNFPCGCTRDGCSNTSGRIEFNPVRVRTHFIHTLMRLGLEKKNEDQREAQKRQWAEAHAASASCMTNMTSYERERGHNHEDGLLRDVSLSPRVEVESCVNAGSFSNVHTANPANQPNNMQEDMNYRYRDNVANHRDVSENNVMHMGNPNHSGHAEPYNPNMLQGKGPPYPMPNNIDFNTMSHNVQRFPCDLNYSYTTHTDNNHHFKNLQSFSASSFEEFAHNSHMNMFSHYGQVYVPEYMPKQNSVHDQNPLQYHAMTQEHYQAYKNSSEPATDNKGEYTTLMSMPYHANAKPQAVENDENWYSHNTLLGLDHVDQATQDAVETPAQSQPSNAPAESATDNTENFGELIKKTMVESVSV